METPLRRAPSISMFFALFCFFLPFLTISCPAGRFSFSGLQVATGTTIEEAPMFGDKTERTLPAEPLATGALGFTVLAALISLAAGRGPRIATGAIGALNFILLLLLKSKLDHDALAQGGGMLQVSWGAGYWLALLGYASTAAIVFLVVRGGEKTQPAAGTALIQRE